MSASNLDGEVIPFPAMRRDLVVLDLTDPDLTQSPRPSVFIAVASDGHAYLLDVDANNLIQGLASTMYLPKPSVALVMCGLSMMVES